jgi:hypothetical protein
MALRPLESQSEKWDKVLFINDVFFDVEGALRLLWGTYGEGNKADTKAVCAADFIEPWRYYDTFATRDTEGYSLGVPIFPWFANVGQAISRKDVLAGKDRVRVKSCWGGMVASTLGVRNERERWLLDRLWISSQSGKSEEEQVALAMAEFGSGVVRRRGLVGELRDKEYWRKEGYYIPFNRTARRGGYCGVRQLLVLKEDR